MGGHQWGYHLDSASGIVHFDRQGCFVYVASWQLARVFEVAWEVRGNRGGQADSMGGLREHCHPGSASGIVPYNLWGCYCQEGLLGGVLGHCRMVRVTPVGGPTCLSSSFLVILCFCGKKKQPNHDQSAMVGGCQYQRGVTAVGSSNALIPN